MITDHSLLVLNSDIAVESIGVHKIAFVPAQQKLFELSGISPKLWHDLSQGVTVADFLSSSDTHGSRQLVSDLCSAGLVEVIPLEEPFRIYDQTVLDLGTIRVGIHFSGEDSAKMIRDTFGHLESKAPPHRHLVAVETQNGVGIAAPGEETEHCNWESFIPQIKIKLTDLLLRSTNDTVLHVGTLTSEGGALALCGEPGAGKSTLSVMLGASDFTLEGDDLAILGDDSRIQALPFPATIKSGAWDMLAPACPGLIEKTQHERPDGKQVKYLELNISKATPASLRLVLLLDRGNTPGLTRLSVTETLGALLAGAWAKDRKLQTSAFAALARAVNGAHAFRLSYDDLEEGAALARDAWKLAKSPPAWST